jgi:CRP/FNR family transcriptional regulator, cyclic AMP receptor protein
MSNIDNLEVCYFCKKGKFVTHTETIAFHQWTDKGYVFCRARVPLRICDHCGLRDWNEETEALIEEAVRREYDKVPLPESVENDATIFHGRPLLRARAEGASGGLAPGGPCASSEMTPIVPVPRAPKSPFGPVDKLAPLRNHPLFREFPPAVIEHLGTYITRRSVRRGTTIFAKGDPATALMAVLWGSVKISVPTSGGHDAVLNIIDPGQVFGEIALLDGQPRTADAVAMTDCELMVIARRDFIPFLRSEPDVALKLIESLCARIRRTSEQVEDVMYMSLPARLAKSLPGYEYLHTQNVIDAETLTAVRHHHEYLDGSGYPDGLSAQKIDDLARITIVCNLYGAMMERRAYNDGAACL